MAPQGIRLNRLNAEASLAANGRQDDLANTVQANPILARGHQTPREQAV
jgi:hypothetical protein